MMDLGNARIQIENESEELGREQRRTSTNQSSRWPDPC